MEHFQCVRQDIDQYVLYSLLAALVIRFIQALFSQFNIPVTIGIPDEIIHFVSGVAEFEFIEISRNLADRIVERGENPAVN